MRLGGKMQYGARLMLSQQSFDQLTVAYVAVHKHMARVLRQRL